MGIPAFPHSASDQFFSCVVFWAAIWAAVFSCKSLKQNRFLYQYGNSEQSAQMALLPLQHSQKTQLTRSFTGRPHSRVINLEKYNLTPGIRRHQSAFPTQSECTTGSDRHTSVSSFVWQIDECGLLLMIFLNMRMHSTRLIRRRLRTNPSGPEPQIRTIIAAAGPPQCKD